MVQVNCANGQPVALIIAGEQAYGWRIEVVNSYTTKYVNDVLWP